MSMQPTSEQLAAYRRDGFLVVEQFVPAAEVERVRERWPRLVDAQRRAIISHFMATGTRWNPAVNHPVYSRYRRPGETEPDEAFFPVLWREDGYRTAWVDPYLAGERP
jgi:Phytanoyl-CoA dioxygenase (PhyH)